jgi:ParB-like chromosome segregation protein Spo0J
MLSIPIQQVIVSPNRQRRSFEPAALQELADSIERSGLLHPIVVRPTSPADETFGWTLVCGERRLRAIRDYLWPLGGILRCGGETYDEGLIPCIPIGELDELAAEEAELEENIRRVDLSWQESAAATARLATLRAKQAAVSGDAPPSVAAISEEVRGSGKGGSYEDTRRELILAKHLDDPEVAAAKTRDDAWKMLKRKETSVKNAELAATVGATFSSASHQLLQQDSLAWMAQAEGGIYDVILTDPPYGMGADEFGDSGGGAAGAHAYEDTFEAFEQLVGVLADQSFRLAKPQAHLYCFCDLDQFAYLRSWFNDAGWRVFRTPMVWHKPAAFRAPWPDHGPQRKYELILYAVKGDRPTTGLYPDVVSFNTDDNLGWAAQKPVALFHELLRRSVRPGDAVLDPFCGTGPIFPAAHALKCRATGLERDPTAAGIAARRIQLLKEVA